jgi:hypothetical protein
MIDQIVLWVLVVGLIISTVITIPQLYGRIGELEDKLVISDKMMQELVTQVGSHAEEINKIDIQTLQEESVNAPTITPQGMTGGRFRIKRSIPLHASFMSRPSSSTDVYGKEVNDELLMSFSSTDRVESNIYFATARFRFKYNTEEVGYEGGGTPSLFENTITHAVTDWYEPVALEKYYSGGDELSFEHEMIVSKPMRFDEIPTVDRIDRLERITNSHKGKPDEVYPETMCYLIEYQYVKSVISTDERGVQTETNVGGARSVITHTPVLAWRKILVCLTVEEAERYEQSVVNFDITLAQNSCQYYIADYPTGGTTPGLVGLGGSEGYLNETTVYSLIS